MSLPSNTGNTPRSKTLRVLIVEDEPLIAEDLAAMLAEQGHQVCGRAHRASDALGFVQHERPDLVLLDIRLNDVMDGVDVATHLEKERIPYLYVTSHTDLATMARIGSTKPQGFIRKPFDEDDLRTQIAVFLARNGPIETPEHVLVRDKGRIIRVPIADIVHAEADDNYTTLHTAERKYVLVSSLSAVEVKLGGKHLLRVHRKYAVDMRRVTGMDGHYLLIGERRIPVGRTHLAEVQHQFGLRR